MLCISFNAGLIQNICINATTQASNLFYFSLHLSRHCIYCKGNDLGDLGNATAIYLLVIVRSQIADYTYDDIKVGHFVQFTKGCIYVLYQTPLFDHIRRFLNDPINSNDIPMLLLKRSKIIYCFYFETYHIRIYVYTNRNIVSMSIFSYV